jgi:hypothetical protein
VIFTPASSGPTPVTTRASLASFAVVTGARPNRGARALRARTAPTHEMARVGFVHTLSRLPGEAWTHDVDALASFAVVTGARPNRGARERSSRTAVPCGVGDRSLVGMESQPLE